MTSYPQFPTQPQSESNRSGEPTVGSGSHIPALSGSTPDPGTILCRHCGLAITLEPYGGNRNYAPEWHSDNDDVDHSGFNCLSDESPDGQHEPAPVAARPEAGLVSDGNTTPANTPSLPEPTCETSARRLPITLLPTPGVMGTLGALALHLVARCPACNGKRSTERHYSPATMRDPEAWSDAPSCQRCNDTGIFVYVDGEQGFDTMLELAVNSLRGAERKEAEARIAILRAESLDSYRAAHGRKPFACEKCGGLQDASTGACVICGGLLVAKPVPADYVPVLDPDRNSAARDGSGGGAVSASEFVCNGCGREYAAAPSWTRFGDSAPSVTCVSCGSRDIVSKTDAGVVTDENVLEVRGTIVAASSPSGSAEGDNRG